MPCPITYDEIDNIVINYKQLLLSNTPEDYDAASKQLEQMINLFDGYIIKWVTILKGGNPNMSDKETISFIALIGKNLQLSNINDVIDKISSVFARRSYDELYSDILVLFIETITRFEKLPRAHFTYYLTKVFYYKVYRLYLKQSTIISRENLIDHIEIDTISSQEPDYNVECITESLDDSELELYTLFNDKNMSYDEIASLKGLSRGRIVEKIRIIHNKIREWIDNDMHVQSN
jgi:DNA-directed RNA polymerase specialized sigma24 family protein